MSSNGKVLAVIPARGGSKGLPGKNISPFAGLPLIAHSILFARMCPEIDRCIISTDSPEIADVARGYDADVPFLRPPDLAQDDTPMWPVIHHALDYVEENDGVKYELVILLDPTSPGREPADVAETVRRMRGSPDADGIIGVSQPDFNPIWHCVTEQDGWMRYVIEGGSTFDRRQEVPPVYRINGSIYVWRSEFVRRGVSNWSNTDRNLIFEIPEYRAMSIDTADEFRRSELLVEHGLINFPWLDRSAARSGQSR